VLILIQKSKRIWTIGQLDDFRPIFKTFIYILFFSFFMYFPSNPPRGVNKTIKVNSYKLGGLFFLPPQSSKSSRQPFSDTERLYEYS